MNLLYIDNRWINYFDELVEVFNRPEAKNSDEPLYDRLIDLAIDNDLGDFLDALGKSELSKQIRNIEIDGDPRIMESLQKIITGKIVPIPKDTNSRIRFISATIDTDSSPSKAIFRAQILKVKQETVKFSVLSKKQKRKDKFIHLNEYKKNDEIEIRIDLDEPNDTMHFVIDGKEVCQCMPSYLTTFQCDVPDAVLAIDSRRIEQAFPIGVRLSCGNYTIRVSKKGYEDYKKKIVVSRKNTYQIELQELPFNKDISFTIGSVSFVMKPVKGGEFFMGASRGMSGNNYYWGADKNESPVHEVSLSDYYIGETTVTQALYEVVMDGGESGLYSQGNIPKVRITWEECQRFIKELNKITSRKFRLPTEAEWEYAARGGKDVLGVVEYSGEDAGWNSDTSGHKLHPVKQRIQNKLGLYDMSGNVWEWCQDWYGEYKSERMTNPIGPSFGSQRVVRGGCYNNCDGDCRVSRRVGYNPESWANGIGFRLVLEL